jgi:hypothetical protein
MRGRGLTALAIAVALTAGTTACGEGEAEEPMDDEMEEPMEEEMEDDDM